MPRGDRTGPYGTGPRGGVCVGAGVNRFSGYGGGRGFGRGAGRGAGWGAGWGAAPGYGMGMGYGRGYATGYNPVSPEAEKEALEFRAKELERELAVLKSRLEENSVNTES
ncbi:MAG: DUF5320 domain-containing protein [Candidatus Fermentibacteraceae bacterium]|nr:DUF5320 domain-containing protein [Candidatus Fermentibacteraceae bacterium]